MNDPRAQDLMFLVEDAKLLHKKLMALEMEDMDLEKVGLFSNEALASFQTLSKPQLKKKPSPLPQEKPLSRRKSKPGKLQRSTSSSSSQSMASPKISVPSTPKQSTSFPRMVALSPNTNNANYSKSKSLRRNFFSVFDYLKSPKRGNSDAMKYLKQPRHSIATLFSNRSHDRAPDQSMATMSRSLNQLHRRSSAATITTTSTSSATNLNRSSSLDILSCRNHGSELMATPPSSHQTLPTSPTYSLHSSMCNSPTDSVSSPLQSRSPSSPRFFSRHRNSMGVSVSLLVSQESLGEGRSVSVPPSLSSSCHFSSSGARAVRERVSSNDERLRLKEEAVEADACSVSLGGCTSFRSQIQQRRKGRKARLKSSPQKQITSRMGNGISHPPTTSAVPAATSSHPPSTSHSSLTCILPPSTSGAPPFTSALPPLSPAHSKRLSA